MTQTAQKLLNTLMTLGGTAREYIVQITPSQMTTPLDIEAIITNKICEII